LGLGIGVRLRVLGRITRTLR